MLRNWISSLIILSLLIIVVLTFCTNVLVFVFVFDKGAKNARARACVWMTERTTERMSECAPSSASDVGGYWLQSKFVSGKQKEKKRKTTEQNRTLRVAWLWAAVASTPLSLLTRVQVRPSKCTWFPRARSTTSLDFQALSAGAVEGCVCGWREGEVNRREGGGCSGESVGVRSCHRWRWEGECVSRWACPSRETSPLVTPGTIIVTKNNNERLFDSRNLHRFIAVTESTHQHLKCT